MNLFLTGRKGMHGYGDLYHFVLTSMIFVANICKNEDMKPDVRDENFSDQHSSNEVSVGLEPRSVEMNLDCNVEHKSSNQGSLYSFVVCNPINRWFLIIGIPIILLQLIVFKFFYPFAGFINGDSYVYLETGYHNLIVNTYPIGYSKFLRLFSVFTHSDTALIAFQYLLLQLSTFSLLFTIFFFYSPAKITRIFLFSFMLINPIYLYLANYVSSDAFFLSLSLIWFTLLLWIMNRPTNRLIIVNSLVLFIAFTVRYNALFYPVISCVALLLTRRKVWMNILGFGVSLALIGVFIHVASVKYYQISGYRQFTPFTGWQIANNALYAYRYVDSSDRKTPPAELKQLDDMVRHYFDTSRDIKTHPIEAMMASTVYMWDPRSPLCMYMELKSGRDSTASALKKWAVVAPMMKKYGDFLIKTYPREFVKFYIIPNAIKYYVPPVEFLAQYSTGVDSVNLIAKTWFDYKSDKISCRFKDFNVTVLDFYPVMTGTMNVILVLSLISFWALKGYKQSPQLMKLVLLVGTLWAVNFAFSVFASPIALRFQLFPIVISISFTFLMIEFLVRSAYGESGESSSGLVRTGGVSNGPIAV